jgi:hypothetical protein
MKIWLSLLLGGILVSRAQAAEPTAFGAAACEGTYEGHLQGVCTDGRAAIYWSWTKQLVKTDTGGRVLRSVPVANHHGDLCYREGRVYVAVNLGNFNQPAGQADSWVYVYDGETLAEIARHPVPELVHGAGGIACAGDTFIIVGGLPKGVSENYLYEYDSSFRFRRRHVLASGFTPMGIQTAAHAADGWWFGTYSDPRTVLRADAEFRYLGQWGADVALGLAPLADGRFLVGSNERGSDGRYRGKVSVARFDPARGFLP